MFVRAAHAKTFATAAGCQRRRQEANTAIRDRKFPRPIRKTEGDAVGAKRAERVAPLSSAKHLQFTLLTRSGITA